MADLTGKTIANGYPNLVTIGATTDDNPTTGTLENGKGNNLTSVTFDGAVVVNESGGNNDFRVEGDTDQNLLFVDASTDRVGIGTNAPTTKLEVKTNSGTSGGPYVSVRTPSLTTAPDFGGFQWYKEDTSTPSGPTVLGSILINNKFNIGSYGDMIFNVPRSGVANDEFMRIQEHRLGIGTTSPAKELDVNGEIRASGGILFGTDTAAANTLDDYEEGTWTPVYSPQTGSFATMTMDVVSANYTKVGRKVTVCAQFRTDNVDATGASNALRISGLPFSSAGSNVGTSAISVSLVSNWSTAPDSGFVRTGESAISLTKSDGTTVSQVSDLTTGAVADQNTIILTATYFT